MIIHSTTNARFTIYIHTHFVKALLLSSLNHCAAAIESLSGQKDLHLIKKVHDSSTFHSHRAPSTNKTVVGPKTKDFSMQKFK